MMENKKWIIIIEDEKCEYGVREIATLITPEVPVVGNYVKFCKIDTYQIIEVTLYASSAIREIEDNEVRDGLPYIVDEGDNNGRSVYGVAVKLCE